MPTQNEIIASIESIAREKLDLPFAHQNIGPGTLLFNGGLELDSFNIVDLIGHLEAQFSFEFQESDFTEEHFRTIGAIGNLVNRYLNGNGGQLEWDYTAMAESYSARPGYSGAAIDALVEVTGLVPGDPVLDLGAGTGHLTLMLATRKLKVTAAEPNRRMREIGISRTAGLANVRWQDAVMEHTGLPAATFALAAYGSSFGVADYDSTLREAHRLLRPGGAMASLFNRRDLNDALQSKIEALIHREVPAYDYGNRRRDQAPFIESSGLFLHLQRIEVSFVHEQRAATWVAAWSSHATLARQAGSRLPAIVAAIKEMVLQHCGEIVRVPYTTIVWIGTRA